MITDSEDLTYYPAFDGNGNVMGYYAADTGASVAAFEYGPFGELIRETGEKKDVFNFRFSTKYEDTGTGLLYYGYRYYDAEIGRWLNRDPIGEQGGINLYGFVGNSGVNFWDLLGLTDLLPSNFGLKDSCWECEVDDRFMWEVLEDITDAIPYDSYLSNINISSLSVTVATARPDGSNNGTDSMTLLSNVTFDATYTFKAKGKYEYFEYVICRPNFWTRFIFNDKKFKGDLINERTTGIVISTDVRCQGIPIPISPNQNVTTALATNQAERFNVPEFSGSIEDVINENEGEERIVPRRY